MLTQQVIDHVDLTLRDFFDLQKGVASSSVIFIDPACHTDSLLPHAIKYSEYAQKQPYLWVGIGEDSEELKSLHQSFKQLRKDSQEQEFRKSDSLRSVRLRASRLIDVQAALPEHQMKSAHVVICGFPTVLRNVNESKLQSYWLQEMGGQLQDVDRILRDYPRVEMRTYLYSHLLYWCWAMAQVRKSEIGGVVGFWIPKFFLQDTKIQEVRNKMMNRFDEIHFVKFKNDHAKRSKDEGKLNDLLDSGYMIFGLKSTKIKERVWKQDEVNQQCTIQFVSKNIFAGSSENQTEGDSGKNAKDQQPVVAKVSNKNRQEINLQWNAMIKNSSWPDGWVAIHEIFPFYRTGVQTARDKIAVAKTKQDLQIKLESFLERSPERMNDDSLFSKKYFDPELAREKLKTKPIHQWMQKIDYRPFDKRWFVNCSPLCHRPRKTLQRAMQYSEFCMVTVKSDLKTNQWNHFGVTEDIPDNGWLTTQANHKTVAFPTHNPQGKNNVDDSIVGIVASRLMVELSHVDLFYFALSVISNESYRKKYRDLLKRNFAVIPLPDEKTFSPLISKGKNLVSSFCKNTFKATNKESTRIGHRNYPIESPFTSKGLTAENEWIEHLIA